MKKFFSNLDLKFSLLRIWFMKNIVLFLKTFLLVSLILIFTGVVKKDTFLIGWIAYPIFGPFIDAINGLTTQTQTILDIVGILLSLIATIGIFSMRAKNIALSDIKSSKLKLALLKAGLYFDSNGKLTRKPEGDESEGVGEAKFGNENIIVGLKRATDEFITVVSAKIENEVEETMEENENISVLSSENNEIESEEIEEPTGETEEEDKKRIIKRILKEIRHFFRYIISRFLKIFKRNRNQQTETEDSSEEENEDSEETSENNTNTIASPIVLTVQNNIPETIPNQVQSTSEDISSGESLISSSNKEDILNALRRRSRGMK